MFKYLLPVLPLTAFTKMYYDGTKTPCTMTILGNRRMIVYFTQGFGIKVNSIYHTCNGEKLDYSYSHNCDNLVVKKHTMNDTFINDMSILSIQLPDEESKGRYNAAEIVELVKESSLKSHLVYSTYFSKNNELTLEWAKDADFVYDDRF
jgi:hypothetical protein